MLKFSLPLDRDSDASIMLSDDCARPSAFSALSHIRSPSTKRLTGSGALTFAYFRSEQVNLVGEAKMPKMD